MPLDATGFAIPDTQLDRDLAVLRAAREGIARPGGWCQGQMQMGNARCAVGWIFHVAAVAPPYTHADIGFRLLQPVLPASQQNGITNYNDTYGRTQGQMIDLFDRAIARLETQGNIS